MYTQGRNNYYGPLYVQGLVPDYLPGHEHAASQRQPVNTLTLDASTGTRPSSLQNEPSFLASVTLKVINPANKKDTKNFVLRPSCHKKLEITKQYGDQVPHTNDFEVGRTTEGMDNDR